MKTTTLSWASKAEMPREYRRILGRRSSAVKESDSVYSRDLSFGPVRALERVFVMIREKSFAPDGQRSQFFPMTPQPGAAPAFPPTPVFQAFAPKTPVASFTKVPDESLPEAELKNPSVEVKEETSEADAMSGQGVALSISETIEISSDSESASSSEAESNLFSSEDERKGDVTPSKMPRFVRVPESPGMDEVWMQNPSTKIVHSVVRSESLQSGVHITKCGRRADKNFTSVAILNDWTAKCRVCFKGRRQPEVG